ncbi:MAG: carboxypeptidase-like regulatory domain-containing protein [Bacteroidota bacterium]
MSAQVTLAGTTQDAETGKPVPYVNIGVLNQNIGTVSGPDGSFTLVVHNENLQDTLKLSSVGYTPLLLVVDAAAQKLTTGTYLPLQPHVMELSEVVVEGNRPNAVLLGNKNRTELLQVGFREATLGHEVGIRYKVKHPDTFLKTFRGYILNNNSETMRFRLNFYTVKKGWPGEKLVQQNILFTLDQEEGVFEVDLTPYSIFMDEDFFCTIELIENQNQDEVIMFAGTWLGTKMPFRETSQGKWDTYRSVSLGFQIDAAY